MNSAVRSLSEEHGEHVEFLDVAENVCPKDPCKFLDNGMLLYKDSDHLSNHGAERLAPLFAEVFSVKTESSSIESDSGVTNKR